MQWKSNWRMVLPQDQVVVAEAVVVVVPVEDQMTRVVAVMMAVDGEVEVYKIGCAEAQPIFPYSNYSKNTLLKLIYAIFAHIANLQPYPSIIIQNIFTQDNITFDRYHPRFQ